jgi:uncharacterized protein (DUF1800 family)
MAPMPRDSGGTSDGSQFDRVYDPVTGETEVVPFAPGPDLTPTRVSYSGSGMTPSGPAGAVATPPLRMPDQPAAARKVKGGVSRRALLIGAGVGAVGLGAAGAGLGAVLLHQGAQHHTATLTDLLASDAAKINHLLRRAGFGATPSQVGDYLAAGAQGTVDRLLNFSQISDDLDSRLSSYQFDYTKPQDLSRWFLLRMIYSQRPLEEKMTLFWHGVLTSSFSKLGKAANYPYLITQNNLLRSKGLGRFDDLIHDISIDPAMLYWLDGRASTGKAPNENYARELMELFTLGIADVNGKPNYTQDDVHNGALALAGWVDENGKGMLVPNRKYNSPVTYLGKTGNLGLSDVVQLVCSQPATGRFIAWRMWQFFAYPTTLSDPVLQPLADAYTSSNHNIAAMVRAMLTSPDFFGDKAYRARVKSPTEFFVGVIRGLGLEVGAQDLTSAAAVMSQMGQVLFDPPNVSGWDGDKDSGNWLGTQNWMTRVNYINTLVYAATGGTAKGNARGAAKGGNIAKTAAASAPAHAARHAPAAATVSAVQQLINTYQLKSAQDVASYFIASLLDNQLGDDRRAVLNDALTQGGNGATLTLAGGGTVSAAGVRQMLYLLMAMPEFQMN